MTNHCTTLHKHPPKHHAHDIYTHHRNTHTLGTHTLDAPRRHTQRKHVSIEELYAMIATTPLCICILHGSVCGGNGGVSPPCVCRTHTNKGVFGGEGGRTGRRRCYHRLRRQKLCLKVSSDPKLVSGTLRAVFDAPRIRTRDPRFPSPAT